MFRELSDRYLAAVDEILPGFVTGLYVVGSVALGAWQAGVSDVDTVILTSRAAGERDLEALRQVHAAMPDRPKFDGVYLEPSLQGIWPIDRRAVPFVVDGTLKTDAPCGELTPVVWQVLKEQGICVRGPAVDDLGVRVDAGELRQYNLENLRTYWQAAVAEFPRQLEGVPRDEEIDGETVSWFVLGPARLHYTVAYGQIVPKNEAGAYLARLFPKYSDIVARSVRWRAGEEVRFTVRDLETAAEIVNVVAEDANGIDRG